MISDTAINDKCCTQPFPYKDKQEIRGRPPDEKAIKNKEPPKPLSTKRLAVSLLIKIAAIALAVWLVFTFVLGIAINYGNNMHPAVNDGDLIISFKMQRPYLNAAVLYSHDGKKRTGRVVGLPGNVIDISKNGELLINNAIASEDIYYPTYKAENSTVSFLYTVEEGKAFILNDYREDILDSRSFGAVDLSDIDGPLILSLRRRGF
jgi:signal peptidase I